MSENIIIAIDGPSASGKGTIARGMADYFEFSYLDTGLLYRAVGRKVFEYDENFNEATAIHIAQNFDISWLDHPLLRNDDSSSLASKVAVIAGVRQALLEFQRHFSVHPAAEKKGSILDGRDIGTIICPNAQVKLFITASADVRAKRRFEELRKHDDSLKYETVLQDIQIRDERDMNRSEAPLKPAQDSLLLDTSNMCIKEAIAEAVRLTENILGSAR